MDHCLFISDLHLCDSRPHITQAFIAFLENTAVKAQALYILGDLFEYWAGDDSILTGDLQPQTSIWLPQFAKPLKWQAKCEGLSPQNIPAKAGYSCVKATIHALNKLATSGVQVFFMHGNRDFLIDVGFASATGIKILPDPSLITLYGKLVLLSHGDELCADDVAYQQFRSEVRSATWKNQFLSKPLSDRVAYIEQLRTQSEQAKSSKSMQIMDVNSAAVDRLLRDFKCPPIFIHGHTHRPNNHLHQIDGNACERWVLGDWYEQGSYLKLDANGCESQNLET